jgi:hypothetical protein
VAYKNPIDNTIRLFKGYEKTSVCEGIENYILVTISKEKDLIPICKSCHRSIGLALKTLQERKESLMKGRSVLNKKILESRTKRGLSIDINSDQLNPRRRQIDLSIENTENAEVNVRVFTILP